MIDKKAILGAVSRIENHIHQTPLLTNSFINETLGCEIFFKCENFQKTGSFKARGATNSILKLSEKEKKQGVVTHSSGNHGQALAWAAKKAGVKAYIVMPSNAPKIKKDAVAFYGAEVIECEPTLQAREEGLKKVQQRTDAVFIPPYNAFNTVEGQATAAYEIFKELKNIHFVFCPVGGGGLLSGTALSTHYFSPSTRVMGCEPEMADDAFQSFRSGLIVPSENPETIADGLRTSLGSITFPFIKELVSDILLCSEDNIKRALELIWQRMKIIVEPSGAVPLACLLQHRESFKGKRIAIIISGGNVDLNNTSSLFLQS